MDEEPLERKLAAILHADVVGYSRLMGQDEEATLRTLTGHRQLMAARIRRHKGRVVDMAGDSLLAEFSSVVDALECAAGIQADLAANNAELLDDRRLRFRIGINLGDVIVRQGQIYGNGINVAARIQALAEPGSICVSGSVYDAVGNRLPFDYEFLGEQSVKNIEGPVRVYGARLKADATLPEPGMDPGTQRQKRGPVILPLAGTLLLVLVGLLVWQRPLERDVHSESVEPAVSLPVASPSLAVLPLENFSGDPEQEYFSDGITDDLITDLTKISGLMVIARDSAFTYKGGGQDVRQVARQLGVRYVLQGSVRRVEDRIRINTKLVDATTGNHVWAERYDGKLDDIFGLQDRITGSVVAALAVKLSSGERESLAQRDTTDLEAYELFLRGRERYFQFSRDNNLDARKLYEEALGRDPGFAQVYAWLALTHWLDFSNGWTDDPERSLDTAQAMASRAISLNDALPVAYFVSGLVLRERKDYVGALVAAEKSIALDPNYANGRILIGSVLYFTGRAEEGLEQVKQAMRLNPHHPHNYPLHLGHAYFLLGRYEEAIDAFQHGLQALPTSQRLRLWLAASYAQAGQLEEAAWELEQVRLADPAISIQRIEGAYPFRYSADLANFLDALRAAGLE